MLKFFNRRWQITECVSAKTSINIHNSHLEHSSIAMHFAHSLHHGAGCLPHWHNRFPLYTYHMLVCWVYVYISLPTSLFASELVVVESVEYDAERRQKGSCDVWLVFKWVRSTGIAEYKCLTNALEGLHIAYLYIILQGLCTCLKI